MKRPPWVGQTMTVLKRIADFTFFRDFFLNLSLNKKLIAMMLFLSFILLSILLILHWQAEKALISEFEKQTAELSKAIQVGVEKVTASRLSSESGVEQYMRTLKSKGIKEVSIISSAEEIIASSNPTKVGLRVSSKRKELIIKAQLGEQVSSEGKTYNVMIPVIAGKTHYGYIHLQINTEDISELQRRNMIKRIVATLLVFSFGMGISIFLAFRYTEPIHNVVQAARRVAAGDLNANLTVDRRDEIGDLTQSFNFMINKLREDRRLEERLREAEHLSAVGQLSRSIAHEIRNPLNYISLCIDHIKEKYRPDSKSQADFETLISSIKLEIHRLDKLVSDFLDYGKPLKLNMKICGIKKILDDVVEIIKVKAQSDKVSIAQELNYVPNLMIDAELMKTCFFNIIINAFQAMPDGGTLRIRTEREDENFILCVSDTGFGISKESLSKIFEPFFTTKSGGLGLGLATTKRVIEEHGGKIDATSIQGIGSQITISLPVQPQGS